MQAILLIVLKVRILSEVGSNYIFSCPSLVCINVDLFLLFIHMNRYDYCLFCRCELFSSSDVFIGAVLLTIDHYVFFL